MDKIFAGSAKVIQTKFGEMTKISFSKSDLDKLQAEAVKNNGWVNTVLKEKKDKIEGKPTHYLEVDNWKPSGEVQQSAPTPAPDESSLPF